MSYTTVSFVAHCASKIDAVLTRETSEVTGPYLWPPNRMAFRTSAVTELLCYFTYLHQSNLQLRSKIFNSYYMLTIAVNKNKVVIKILQDNAVAETT